MADPTTDIKPIFVTKAGQARYDRRSNDEKYKNLEARANNLEAKREETKIQKLNKAISEIEKKINEAYYGNRAKNTGIKFPGNPDKVNGLYPILLAINEIDFCNLVNYITNKLLTGNPDSPSIIVRSITTLQSKAKNLINSIDSILIDSDSIVNNNIKVGDIVTLNIDIPGLGNQGQSITLQDNEQIRTLKNNTNSYQKNNNKFKETLLILRDSCQELSSIINEPEILTAVPQLSQGNNFISDFLGKLDKTVTLDSIPNSEVQSILKKIRDLRAILSLIVGINSLRDALGAVQSLTKLNIDKQVDKIQKSIDISKLIPIIKNIIKFVNSINQAGQKALKYIKLAVTFVRLLTGVIRIFKLIIKLYNKLFLPMKFITFGKGSKMQSIKSKFELRLEIYESRVGQMSTLIQTIYRFVSNLTNKLRNINVQLQILQSNLEICENTNESPILEEIKTARNKIVNTIEELDNFINKIDQANNNNETIFGSYVLKIQEEELVDEEIKYKRRRGIAFDTTGTLVAQTDLTFATDTNIILEELKLKLQNLGLPNSTGASGTGYQDLDALLEDITLEEDNTEEDDTETDEEYISIQNELDTVIDSIKGASKLKRRVRQRISKQLATLNEEIKEGNPPASITNATSGIDKSVTDTPINTGSESTTTNVDILSKEQRDLLERDLKRYIDLRKLFIANYDPNKNFIKIATRNPIYIKYTKTIKDIEGKLDRDTKARLAGG
jgi:hypothetical protein